MWIRSAIRIWGAGRSLGWSVKSALRLAVCAALACAALASGCITDGDVLTSLPPPEPRVPRAADDFVDSIGVTVLYASNDHFAVIEQPALERLGVRHVRDWAMQPSENAEQVAMLRMLGEAGIRSQLIFEPRFGLLPEHFAPIATALGDALESVEGANDNDANDEDLSTDDVVAQLRGLRAAIDEAGLAGQVALVDALDIEPEEKGDLSEVLDYGNFERERDRTLPAIDLSDRKEAARLACGAKPLMVTECGYSTTDSPMSVSEDAAAKYLLRLLLGHFAQNIARTYIDELMDGPEDDVQPFMAQGLLHLDGAEKPAFGALQRLIELLEDEGEAFDLEPLELAAMELPATLRSVLLQKRDGSYALALWQEVPSFAEIGEPDPEVEAMTVTLTFAVAMERIAGYAPLLDESPVLEETNVRTLAVAVPDHPIVLIIER
jgi:hypothetical protein